MLFAAPISNTTIQYDKAFLLDALYEHVGPKDIVVLTPENHNPLIIPFLAFLYTFCLQRYPSADVTFLLKEGEVDVKADYEKVSLTPFDATPVDILALGGSFDRMHYGHKLLVTTSVLLCKKNLIIGINRATNRKKHHEIIQPFHDRVSSCINLVYKLNQDLIVRTEVIDDVAGPTGYIPDIDLLVLSEETIKGGDMVNEIRESKGLKKLKYVAVPLINMATGERLSSSYLRDLEAEKDL